MLTDHHYAKKVASPAFQPDLGTGARSPESSEGGGPRQSTNSHLLDGHWPVQSNGGHDANRPGEGDYSALESMKIVFSAWRVGCVRRLCVPGTVID